MISGILILKYCILMNGLSRVNHPLTPSAGNVTPRYYWQSSKLKLGRSLLLSGETYEQGKLVQLKAQGKSYTIRLLPALERGADYVRAGFDVVAKG